MLKIQVLMSHSMSLTLHNYNNWIKNNYNQKDKDKKDKEDKEVNKVDKEVNKVVNKEVNKMEDLNKEVTVVDLQMQHKEEMEVLHKINQFHQKEF